MEENAPSSLWNFLRQKGLQDLAVDLSRNGVRSRDDIVGQATSLVQNGMSETNVSRLFGGSST